ncbi:MFS transporter [Peribacillus sp. SCS-155]|uniref:MFS transporter n=1 Tax=Peribacillus sedimenti TaxID=3115297 RepID=UPI003905C9C2
MTLKVVLIILFFFQLMTNLTRPLLPLYASQLGASTMEVGTLTAVYAFFPLLLAIHAGKIADRMGDRLPILLGMLFATLGFMIPFFFHSIVSLYVSQIIVGVSHIFIIISLQNVLGNISTNGNRDHYFGIFSMVVAISQFVGPIIGGYLAEYTTYSFAFFAAAIIGIVPIVFAVWIPVITEKSLAGPLPEAGSALQLLKIPVLRKALAGSALVLYSKDIFVAYFPLYAASLHISDSKIGWIIALQGLAMVPVRFFLARLTAWMGRERLLLISILAAGIAFAIIPFTSNILLLMFLSVLMGAGLGCGQPLSMTTIYNASPQSKTGEVLGLRLATNRISQLMAPILFGIIGSGAGLLSVFLVSGAFLVGGAFLTHSKEDSRLVKISS